MHSVESHSIVSLIPTGAFICLQDAPSIREMEAKNGPFAVSASFALTNKPVNALWEWSKVRSGGPPAHSCYTAGKLQPQRAVTVIAKTRRMHSRSS